MTVKELISRLEKLPQDSDVFVKNIVNPCGNINGIGSAEEDEYGFFGKAIPCVILGGNIDENF